MSNRSRGPGNRQPTIGDFAKKLTEGVGRNLQKPETEEDEIPSPSGTLPLPASQVVFPDRYEWVWEAVPEEIHVTAVMSRKDKGWEVRVSMIDTNIRLTPEESKAVGEALLAAWNYQYIWKDGFADLFESGLEVKPLYTDQYKAEAEAKKSTPIIIEGEPSDEPAKGVTQLEAHDNGA
jgi:hypothetical protein